MSETEPARRKPLFVGCTHGVRIGRTGGEGIGGEGHDQRMEDIRGERHQRWEIWIRSGKADVETEDGRSIRSWCTYLGQLRLDSQGKPAE